MLPLKSSLRSLPGAVSFSLLVGPINSEFQRLKLGFVPPQLLIQHLTFNAKLGPVWKNEFISSPWQLFPVSSASPRARCQPGAAVTTPRGHWE